MIRWNHPISFLKNIGIFKNLILTLQKKIDDLKLLDFIS